MPHKPQFRFGLVSAALRETFRKSYGARDFFADLQAGIVVGLVATPLCMGLAIATGVAPWFGLTTAAIGGFFAALFGGSRFQVTGPTAAFIVILVPILKDHGMSGLVFATFLAGLMLIIMSLLRLGTLITKIPHSVVLGFTLGIAIVIASLQVRDVLGWQNGHISWTDAVVGLGCLAFLFLAKRMSTRIPPPLVVLPIAQMMSSLYNRSHPGAVTTVLSRFGPIPNHLPRLQAPWTGSLSTTAITFLMPALGIALLAAIESLLAAMAADHMTRSKHDPDSELLGVGMANIAVSFFGSLAATGAMARTSANIRFGGRSPVSAIVHSLLVLAVIFLIGQEVALLPTSALAALLLYVAFYMTEPAELKRLLKSRRLLTVAPFLASAILTIVHDMVVGVGVGVALHLLLVRVSHRG